MLEYSRDVPADADETVVEATTEHVRMQLAAIADADDDPATRAEDVDVVKIRQPSGSLRITGYLDAEPDAPYLKEGFDPFAGVDPELIRRATGG